MPCGCIATPALWQWLRRAVRAAQSIAFPARCIVIVITRDTCAVFGANDGAACFCHIHEFSRSTARQRFIYYRRATARQRGAFAIFKYRLRSIATVVVIIISSSSSTVRRTRGLVGFCMPVRDDARVSP
jgi:hypothetical protein